MKNNGTILVKTTGEFKSDRPGDAVLGLYGGSVLLTGSGSVKLDESANVEGSTVVPKLKLSSITDNLVNDTHHSIIGEGRIENCRFVNFGLIKAEGSVNRLSVQMPDHRTQTTDCATNAVSGRIVAASPHGIYFAGVSKNEGSHPNWNTHFVNLGLMEARTGSVIAFADGINSTSGKTGDSDLSPTSGDYLKLWGRIAGGGRFQTIRPIHIMDGARLMPGDLANDDGTGDSTCGTLTFATNLVLEAGAALEEGEGVSSGAITEFQCVKTEAGRFDAVWVEGDLTVAGTLRFTAKPHSGTYRIFGATGALTCDVSSLAVECAPGVRAPHLKLVEGTYSVEQPKLDGETGEPLVDDETGEPLMETVQLPCRYLEATWANGLSVSIR